MRSVSRLWAAAVSLVVMGVGLSSEAWSATASTLDAVRARGKVICGVADREPGFSEVSTRGTWSGLDVEFCSALAAAVLGNRDAVKYLSLNPGDRFKSLQDNEIDVLLGATTWTLTRDTELGARFTSPLYYDGQGFIIPRNHSIASVLELSGASICVLTGSSDETAIADFFGSRKMRYQLITSDRWDDLVKTYANGGCTVLTGEVSLLAFEKSRMSNGSDQMLLPEMITKEPYGPAVRTGDDGWFAIVRWTFMSLVAAEELNISSSNVDTMKSSPSHEVRRFLGLGADLGAPLGLARDWAYQVVKQVGNYGEIFERTLGQGSSLKLDRGLNNLWSKGGLMYAAPFR
ncbi:amino acid ABC transporter substrate-binding protein [Hyphomicrobium facile]|uniref:General L-amino acid transport system substrate-binding protein n=1 Tax=Hyphomicrobium facile TaxID=51670 RepID=A0A1I7NBF8_9HYPH|nr:amino acid ABC transporter substrate-binding protein [Hyphomicrobium facile]SFV32002.1 general L-amino acid transport system substrate-binding protein [Hyphomicrobium facile]